MIDVRRTARAAVLTLWAGFFIYLWVSGEQVRYIGPRTLWVIPFGAITLSLAALVHLFTLRGPKGEPLRRSELLGLVVTVLPIAFVAAVPAPELGSLAASKKLASDSLVSSFAYAPPADPDREISFIDVHYANLSEEYATAVGVAEGREMSLVGFVTHDGDQLQLTRFYISCCAADAIPYSVPLTTAETYSDDTWLAVKGTLVREPGGYVLEVTSATPTETPETPYLS